MSTARHFGKFNYSIIKYSIKSRYWINGNYYFGVAGTWHLGVETLESLGSGYRFQMAAYCL